MGNSSNSGEIAYKKVDVAVEDLEKEGPKKKLTPKKQSIFQKLIPNSDKTNIMSFVKMENNQNLWKNQKNINGSDLEITQIKESYNFDKHSGDDEMEWYVNFADYNLFGFYFTDLFAQDEILLAMHPHLFLLKEYVSKYRIKELKLQAAEEEGYYWNPVLIMNAQRLGEIQIEKDNCPSIYGNKFKATDQNEILSRVNVLEQKVYTNIIAMTAQNGGKGKYSEKQIEYIFKTAFCSFQLASTLSLLDKNKRAIISTGNWGCGAFGNNYQLMALAQLSAAKAAGVKEIRYHTFSNHGDKEFQAGKASYESFNEKVKDIKDMNKYYKEFLQFAKSQQYVWGKSDGN